MNRLFRWLRRHPRLCDYLKGIGMAIDPAPTDRSPKTLSDAEAFAEDWRKVGDDMWAALNRITGDPREHVDVPARDGCIKGPPPSPELLRLLKESAGREMTEEEIREQRESWVRGEMGLGPDDKR